MCQKCFDAVKKYYPRLPEKHYGDLLMGATAFPFGDAETVERQLKELIEKTDGTLEGAYAFAAAELDKGMAQFHGIEEYDSWSAA